MRGQRSTEVQFVSLALQSAFSAAIWVDWVLLLNPRKQKNKVTHLIVHRAGAGARFHIDRLLSTACVAGSTADGVVDRRHAESFGVWRVSHARQL